LVLTKPEKIINSQNVISIINEEKNTSDNPSTLKITAEQLTKSDNNKSSVDKINSNCDLGSKEVNKMDDDAIRTTNWWKPCEKQNNHNNSVLT